MPITNYNEITEGQYDVLKEIGNIGLGNATTALSKMLNRRIEMKIPQVDLVEINKLADLIGGPENPVVGILVTLSGDISGMMMFAVEQFSARKLVNLVLQQESQEERFSHMDFSVLKEIGNIIAGAYMTSISTLTGLAIFPSVPQACYDMAGAILSVPAIEFGKIGDKALLIDSSFDDTDDQIDGYFIMIPDLESYNKIMSIFGM
ncbi:MAG: chemotaxis protein CheC [Lachnospiraceae bacterium]|nr:chemotaxis protein CheC [Lachnospiraceae bacterium]